MFAIRVAAFIISVLLATHAVQPDDGWFIALAVLTGLALFSWVGRTPRVYLGWPRRALRWVDEW